LTPEFTLPRKTLQCFFGIDLTIDLNVDSDAIKQDLPAVFWQLPKDIDIYWHQPKTSPATPNHYYLMQQRLWLEKTLFSQAIFSLYQHNLELLYLQLLPTTPSIEKFKNNWSKNFQRKYGICITRTLKNINQFSKLHGANTISATLLNPKLVNLFSKSGYSSIKNQVTAKTIIKGYDQFEMIRFLNITGTG
jgi:hypothetical protein